MMRDMYLDTPSHTGPSTFKDPNGCSKFNGASPRPQIERILPRCVQAAAEDNE